MLLSRLLDLGPGVVLGLPALVVGLLLRYGRRRVRRVPVQAVLVSYTAFRTPSKVTFDYPGPDGRWLRAERYEGAVSAARGRWRWVPGTTVWRPEPGAPMTVYVDPTNPADVSLGETHSYRGWMSLALIVVGSVVLLLTVRSALLDLL